MSLKLNYIKDQGFIELNITDCKLYTNGEGLLYYLGYSVSILYCKSHLSTASLMRTMDIFSSLKWTQEKLCWMFSTLGLIVFK